MLSKSVVSVQLGVPASLLVGGAKVLDTRITKNAIIHAIDTVLMPTATEIRMANAGAETAESFLPQEDEYVAEVGDLIVVPAGMAHEIKQVGAVPLKIVSIYVHQ